MKVYDDKHIKNIALLGASKAGKTTLAETMLFEAGLINRRGTVEGKIRFLIIMRSKRNVKFNLCDCTSYRVARL